MAYISLNKEFKSFYLKQIRHEGQASIWMELERSSGAIPSHTVLNNGREYSETSDHSRVNFSACFHGYLLLKTIFI